VVVFLTINKLREVFYDQIRYRRRIVQQNYALIYIYIYIYIIFLSSLLKLLLKRIINKLDDYLPLWSMKIDEPLIVVKNKSVIKKVNCVVG